MSEIIVRNARAAVSYSEARYWLKRLGIALRLTEFGEFRVNFARGTESTAAYESDLPSAIGTGIAMLDHRTRLESQLAQIGLSPAKAASDARAAVSGAF